MKRRAGLLAALLVWGLTACSGGSAEESQRETEAQTEAPAQTESAESVPVKETDGVETEDHTMKITVGDTVFTATLADNSSAEALKELLQEGPLTIDMRDYGNMEKVGPIGQSLPENNESITTEPGDIILYLGDSLVIYYDTNSWNFTRIGKIHDVTQEELLAVLGDGDVTVTFE